MISEIEQRTLDIDWFFACADGIGFAASGAGKLPLSVAKSNENLAALSTYFNALAESCGVIISDDFKDEGERFLSSFTDMASKGLFAFDKAIPCNFTDPIYVLIAKPEHPLKINDLPEEISSILMQTKYEGKVSGKLNSNLIP